MLSGFHLIGHVLGFHWQIQPGNRIAQQNRPSQESDYIFNCFYDVTLLKRRQVSFFWGEGSWLA